MVHGIKSVIAARNKTGKKFLNLTSFAQVWWITYVLFVLANVLPVCPFTTTLILLCITTVFLYLFTFVTALCRSTDGNDKKYEAARFNGKTLLNPVKLSRLTVIHGRADIYVSYDANLKALLKKFFLLKWKPNNLSYCKMNNLLFKIYHLQKLGISGSMWDGKMTKLLIV